MMYYKVGLLVFNERLQGSLKIKTFFFKITNSLVFRTQAVRSNGIRCRTSVVDKNWKIFISLRVKE